VVSGKSDERIVFVRVPLPKEFVELARARGVCAEELAKAAETLLLLEAVSMESKLEIEDALEIAYGVTRKAWTRLRDAMRQGAEAQPSK